MNINIPGDVLTDKRHPFLVKTNGGNFERVMVAPPQIQVVATNWDMYYIFGVRRK
ncbi:MAG: hypothetical protein LBI81_01560 [Puniceicoccales bacterium]|jgi:hypothetical protein|nr:hypothetical protein [Puniceicoccales bacterium]